MARDRSGGMVTTNFERRIERTWLLAAVLPAAVLVAALVLAACSGDDSVTASGQAEPVAEATDTTATDAGSVEDPGDVDEPGEGEIEPATEPADDRGAAQSTAYSEGGIHTILESSCATCHSPEGPGSSRMTLSTAADAVTYADAIGRMVSSGAMPPWPASDLSVPFAEDHSLSDAEIDAIEGWVQGGGAIDVDPATPIVATRPVARIEDRDLVLTSAKGPYRGSPAVEDDYRCLIFDPEITEPEWILASQFEADQTEVVHHGIIHVASGDLRNQAEFYDSADEAPGWTCYDLGTLDTSGGGYQFRMGGWAPGAQPARQPEGYAIPLRPGDFLIVQVHYHYDDEDAPADLSRMVLDLASDDDLAAAGGSFDTLQSALYLGPAEIPCYEGDPDPLCNRAAALARVHDLYGPFGASLPDAFLRQCGSTPADYAHMTDGTAWSTCDLPVVHPGRIVSLTGHMHELGLSIRLTLNPDTPDELILLDIPDWDFAWQFGYRPVDEIVLEEGDVIRVDCAWNRERAPYDAVGYILWADGTGDEMCFSSITTEPLS